MAPASRLAPCVPVWEADQGLRLVNSPPALHPDRMHACAQFADMPQKRPGLALCCAGFCNARPAAAAQGLLLQRKPGYDKMGHGPTLPTCRPLPSASAESVRSPGGGDVCRPAGNLFNSSTFRFHTQSLGAQHCLGLFLGAVKPDFVSANCAVWRCPSNVQEC